jgi:3-oxoacyl-[acyl-carrier protein] reductase
VAAVTGASAGIGAACVEALARRGAAVVLNARRTERLEAIAANLRTNGGRVEIVPGDVTSPAHMKALVAHAVDRFGRLDALVANAGIGFHALIDDTPVDVMQRLMDVNFMGTFHAVKAVMPVFRQQGSGHIVIVSSIVGQRGVGFTSAYSATKAAQIGFAEGLRADLYGSGIHVSVVCPVSTQTEFREAEEQTFGYAVTGVGPRQSAAHVAQAILACLRRPRAEVYPLRLSRALVVLNALAPGLTDRIIQKYGRRRRVD